MSNAFKREVMARCKAKPCPWNQAILAFVISMPVGSVSRILKCEAKRLNVQVAQLFSIALGESAGFWIDKYNAVKMEQVMTPEFEKELEEIRKRAKNWQTLGAEKPKSKEYQRGYRDGYQAAKDGK